eukprot:65820-Amphidinium_carterae.1
MEVDQLEDETLSVKAIDACGLVGAHNLKQDTDSNRIMVGDVIVQINDVANTTDGMLQECKTKHLLRIVLVRRSVDAEESGEETASEATKLAAPMVMRLRADAQAFVPSAHTGQSSVPPGLESSG